MKNKIIYFIILAVGLSVTQSGCKKYEDGPAISFRSSTARLTNHWKISKVTSNANDITLQFSGHEWEILKDGNFNLFVNAVLAKTPMAMLIFSQSNDSRITNLQSSSPM
ncbi:MAG: hypothetical protein EBT60_07625 [Bacteroidetes bacterium]|nr:hypothetical protein [Bacteroidota bacterium]